MTTMRTQPAPPSADNGPILSLFDDLLEQGASLPTLLERAASFAHDTVGVVLPSGALYACAPDGRPVEASPPVSAPAVTLDSGAMTWSRTSPGPGEYFLHRLALAATVLERAAGVPATSEVSLLSALLSADTLDSERLAAAKRLNLEPGDHIKVILAQGERSSWAVFEKSLSAICEVLRSGRLDSRFVAVVRVSIPGPLVSDTVPKGLRVSSGISFPVERAHDAYASAADAFRFALPSPSDHGPYPSTSGTFACADGLGALAVLSRLKRNDIDVPDVRAIAELVERHGSTILTVLEAYASTESLRKAATIAYMHHNSVAYWVRRAEELLGFDPARPYYRVRLMIALCMYRLAGSMPKADKFSA